ncbi:MAG: signal peptidase II [Candidatus Magasanikbacteria bacterium]|nr:signal peptidase II [Candidatus Magasanikbacteria bacterium]
MKFLTRRINIIFFCGFLFFIDRWLKWQALHGWANDRLVNRWLGWHPFLNPGVAFGIPLPSWLIIILTVPVLGLILFLIFKHETANTPPSPPARGDLSIPPSQGGTRGVLANYSLLLIFFGALSNLIDRVLYGHTVDYFLILTAVINVADVMIVAGFVIYFLGKSEIHFDPFVKGRV